MGSFIKGMPWEKDEHSLTCCNFKDTLFGVIEKIIQSGYCHFIIGANKVFDIYVGEILIILKRVYPHISLEVITTPVSNGPKNIRSRYKRVISWSDVKTFIKQQNVSDRTKACNKYMIDNSSLLVALWNGKTNETLNSIKYAVSNNTRVYLIENFTNYKGPSQIDCE